MHVLILMTTFPHAVGGIPSPPRLGVSECWRRHEIRHEYSSLVEDDLSASDGVWGRPGA